MNKADNETKRTGEPPIDDVPELVVEKRRGLSMVWLIPLVAALIGVWLAYKTLSEQGPTVTITFKEGTGLEVGKTKIKYKALEVGLVEAIQFSKDLSHIVVTAKLGKDVESHLGEGTKFWVVRPRVGFSGVSGLETLVSGTYIEVEFAAGKSATAFTGFEQPPSVKADTPGRQYLLLANKLGSLQRGSPIYFRDIQVGEVLSTELASDDHNVLVHVFVNAPYHQLVRDKSRFWKMSGLDVSLGAQGIDVKMESLLTLLSGGITFDTPDAESDPGQPSSDGARFRLFESFASITESAFTLRDPYLLYFDGSVRGLSVDAPVELRGITVGKVTEVKLEVDPHTMKVRIAVVIELNPERFLDPQTVKTLNETQGALRSEGRRPGVEKLIERGLRAQLKTGSLVTGQLFIDLDFFPDDPPRKLAYGGKYPEIPTVPGTLEAFQTTAAEILEQLKKLPLEKLGNELLGTVQGANRLINSPEAKDTIHSLDAALKGVRVLTQTADRQLAVLASSTEKTLGSMRTTLETTQADKPIMIDVANTLEELAAAARSIRVLSDYLERHPEALLYGKSGAKP